MRLKAWEELPDQLKTESVRPYYDALRKKQGALFCKRLTDLLLSAALLVVLSPVLLVLAICIKIDSPGTVFFRQVRVTQYGREFRIFKFRTMVQDAPKLGSAVTVKNDMRITRMGRLLRGCRGRAAAAPQYPQGGDELCRHPTGGAKVCVPVHPRDDGDAAAARGGDLRGVHPV